MQFLNKIIRKGYFFWFLLMGLTLGVLTALPAHPRETKPLGRERRVSFDFKKVPMSEVAAQISAQLNYKVLMDDELASLPISGIFRDVTLDEFFSRRIFRGKNIAILFDEQNHVVTISSLGNKKPFTEYDRTDYTSFAKKMDIYDPMDMEVQPGVKRKDVQIYVDNTDPMDMEVTPGVKRRDVKPYVSEIDPMDMEVVPGIRKRDIIAPPPPVKQEEMEVQPGIKRKDIMNVNVAVDPLELEVQPGIKRRDVLNLPR